MARALGSAAARFPDLGPVPLDTAGLDPRDAALALAIHRTVLQRWLTLEHLLGPLVRGGLGRLEPPLRGLLLAGAAQLLFFDRLPAWAVVHDSVAQARHLVRRGAGGVVNAVLRRVAALVAARVTDEAWAPAADRIPWQGGYVRLCDPCLPPPDRLAAHLAIATSHPEALVRRWRGRFGPRTTTHVCRHGVRAAPTFLAGPEGHRIWRGAHADLARRLHGDLTYRAQDPTAGRPVEATRGLGPATAIDYCAGRGTKTRQLAALHPACTVHATSVEPVRLEELREQFRPWRRVVACRTADLPDTADLLVLDVPCTNTGVLARRPEARYRFRRSAVRSLVGLQRRIAAAALPHARPGGFVLYCTCSLEPVENQDQVRWLVERTGARVTCEVLTVPGGCGASHHDGGYFALLKLPGG